MTDTPAEITGDVAVGASGVAMIQAGAVGTAKLGGDITAAGKALLDDADAAAQRSTLGLGSAATQAASAFEAAGAVAAHAAAADPHTGYQRESEKAQAGGYASLGAGGLVPVGQLATGTPDGSRFLRDDQTWAVPPAGGGGTPSDTVTSETAFGAAASAGAATAYARGDHTHGTPANPVPAHEAAGDPHPQYAIESALAAVASSGSASDLGAGTLPIARIADGAVTLAKLASIATARLLGRSTAGAGVPEELTATQAKALLAIVAGDVSGLAAVATSGSASDLGAGTLPIARIADAAITLAKLENRAQATILGRASGAGAGAPQELTAAQATAILDAFTSTLKGLVPASGGGTANFLRADGQWAAPAGGGGGAASDRIRLTVAARTYTNQGAGPTESNVADRTIVDLANFTNVRLLARVTTTGVSGSIKAQYSTDGTTFADLTTTISLVGTGPKASASQAIPAGAKALVVLRLVAVGGNGTEDPVVESGVTVEVS